MGNKNTIPPRSPEGGITQKEDASLINSATDEAQRTSPELLAALQSLGENEDYTLLPHSLHQIAETYSLKQDYRWAIQFLQLEKLYHERLLSNLAALQEKWEIEFNEKRDSASWMPPDADSISQKQIEKLSHICRTHHRPSLSLDQRTLNAALTDTQIKREILQPCDEAKNSQTTHGAEDKEKSMISQCKLSSILREEEEELQDDREEALEEGQEVEAEGQTVRGEDTPEEEEVKVEWPSGVTQASDKDLAKLSNTEGSSSSDGLVSILKRRRASLDGLPPQSDSADKQNSRRKVRFSEPEDGLDQDELGGDSCLILLLLCLITVVISIGGTALYCTLVDTYSNICTDFTQNVDFYITNARGFLEGLGQWLPLQT
ncbi:PREDICTED: consortin-like isoform X2 [Cyprinodon variegatus]|uniref:Consortin, connexin sorting protein b n=1 Tax=Cyprinodon variegatus TaxID=28743 RepID=A0A3Q2CD87_CYPVA|nr:PREDICTED: consortin-like isoform X2 [Cyprinodon variegatus]